MPRFLLRLFAVAAVVWLAWFVFNRQNGTVEANSTLYLRLTVPMPEVESDGFLPFGSDRPTLRATVAEIRQAQHDAHLSAVVIEPRVSAGMWGQLQELRAAIVELRASGKPVVAYLESGGVGDYYLASAASRVLLMPGGQLDVTGTATYELFFRGALDKLGVTPDLLHVGDYKTYSNTFTERGMTPAHREMNVALNRDAYDELVRAIAEQANGEVVTADSLGWDGDALEAQAFAFLAVRSLRGLPISFPGTTGVSRPLTGGRLHRP